MVILFKFSLGKISKYLHFGIKFWYFSFIAKLFDVPFENISLKSGIVSELSLFVGVDVSRDDSVRPTKNNICFLISFLRVSLSLQMKIQFFFIENFLCISYSNVNNWKPFISSKKQNYFEQFKAICQASKI